MISDTLDVCVNPFAKAVYTPLHTNRTARVWRSEKRSVLGSVQRCVHFVTVTAVCCLLKTKLKLQLLELLRVFLHVVVVSENQDR